MSIAEITRTFKATAFAVGLAAASLPVAPASATAYYIDHVNGSDSNNGLSPTPSGAWKNYTAANNLPVLPGDTVGIVGNYTSNGITITVSGSAGNPITWYCYSGAQVCRVTSSATDGINVQAAYITVGTPTGGFDLTSTLGTGGSSIRVNVNSAYHNIDIGYNKLEGSICDGTDIGSDYTNVHDNDVYNNAPSCPGSGSGISIRGTYAQIDSKPGCHMSIYNNVVYYNVINPGDLLDTDGNGIILDGLTGTGTATGLICVYNNIIFGNGHRGINCYNMQNVPVLIYNNTLYSDAQNPEQQGFSSELFSNKCKGVQWYNNLAQATLTTNWGSQGTPPTMIYTENSLSNLPPWAGWTVGTVGSGTVYYTAGTGDTGWTPGAGMVYGNPSFVSPITAGGSFIPRATILASFNLQPGSNALKAAYPYFCPPTDITGYQRSTVNCSAGAIQATP